MPRRPMLSAMWDPAPFDMIAFARKTYNRLIILIVLGLTGGLSYVALV